MNKRQREIEQQISAAGYTYQLVRVTPHLVYDVTNDRGVTKRTSFSSSPSDFRVQKKREHQLKHLFRE